MRERLQSVPTLATKTLRSILDEAIVLPQEPPTKAELIWGISIRSVSIPPSGAVLICLILDWQNPNALTKDWSNTFLAIAVCSIKAIYRKALIETGSGFVVTQHIPLRQYDSAASPVSARIYRPQILSLH